jgi:hypothetical protein
MNSSVASYDRWWKKVYESKIDHETEFGSEGSFNMGIIIAQNAKFKAGEFIGADRYWAARGETRISKGVENYDYHIFYSPNEFEGWEGLPEFEEYDTRGLRYLWSELSHGKPVVILTPGTGRKHNHKSSEYIAFEDLYSKVFQIPEYLEIMRMKKMGKQMNIPASVLNSLKAKLKEIEFDQRSKDIFDRSEEDPEYIKSMVKISFLMGLR